MDMAIRRSDILAIFKRRISHEGAEQSHYLNMIILGMLTGQTCEGVDAAETNRENLAAEHLRALLVLLIQQTTLRRFRLSLRCLDLLMGRLSLLIRHPDTP